MVLPLALLSIERLERDWHASTLCGFYFGENDMKIRKAISDDQLLDWVRQRAAGADPRDIAPTTPDYCRAATNRVLGDDLKCGDPVDEVKAEYWVPGARSAGRV